MASDSQDQQTLTATAKSPLSLPAHRFLKDNEEIFSFLTFLMSRFVTFEVFMRRAAKAVLDAPPEQRKDLPEDMAPTLEAFAGAGWAGQ